VILLLFLANTMGYYLVFQVTQCLIRREMMSELRKGAFHPDLILLKILHPEKEQQFRRIDKKEFFYYGKMYDVVVERKNGDTTLIYCLHDKKEESLVNDFSSYLLRSGKTPQAPRDHPVRAMFQNLISQALIQATQAPVKEEGVQIAYPALNPQLTLGYRALVAPPPKTS